MPTPHRAAGFLVIIGSPIIEIAGIEYFVVRRSLLWLDRFFKRDECTLAVEMAADLVFRVRTHLQGLGGTCYLGAGAAVMGYSPLIEKIAIINEHFDYWYMVRPLSSSSRCCLVLAS